MKFNQRRSIEILFLWAIFFGPYQFLTVEAAEKDVYDYLWLDPDKSVYVLQNKAFSKKNTFYTDLYYVENLTSKFQDTNGGKIEVGYYFQEEWGIEASATKYKNSDNTTLDNMIAVNGTVPFIRRPTSSYSLMGVWSPFYGKINTFNKIYYFDWSFGAGLGKYNAESNIDTVTDPNAPNTYRKESYNALMLRTKLKFHINKNIHLSLELQSTNYRAADPINPAKKTTNHNTDALVGVGFSF